MSIKQPNQFKNQENRANQENIDLGIEGEAKRVVIYGSDGTEVTSFGGGTQYADGAVRGTATGTLAMGDDGTNIQSVKVDSSGRPLVTVDTALPAGTNAIGKLAANSGVDIGDVDVLSIAAGDNNIGNVDVVTLPSIPSGTNNIGDVDVLTIPGIVGTVADDATTPGNPVMIGGKAVETDGTDPSSVSAEDDVAIARTDRNRRLLVNTAHPNLFSANDNQSTAQTNTVLKAAPGANLSLYITDIMISNGATAGDVRIVEDPAGTPVIKIPKLYFAANGGASKHFNTPIRITANKAIGYTSTTVTTHSILVSGYIAP